MVTWERSHPILRYVAMDSLYVARPMLIELPEPSSAVRVEVLARGRDGPLIVLVERGGVRDLVVGFDPIQSTWPASVGFAVFLAGAVDVLTLRGEREAGQSFTTVEPVTLRATGGELALVGPGGETVPVRRGAGNGLATAGVLERAGVYAVRGGDVPAVAVNMVDGAESALGVADGITVNGLSVAGLDGKGRGGAPREVWPWFVLAGAALLFVEWFTYARRSRV